MKRTELSALTLVISGILAATVGCKPSESRVAPNVTTPADSGTPAAAPSELPTVEPGTTGGSTSAEEPAGTTPAQPAATAGAAPQPTEAAAQPTDEPAQQPAEQPEPPAAGATEQMASASGATGAKPTEPAESSKPPKTAAVGKLAPIDLQLPAPAFRGTPVPLAEPFVEKPLGKPRPPFLAPEGTVNLSRGKRVFASDPAPVAGELDFVVDGDKEASDFGYLELHPGSQWVTIDLGCRAAIYAVVIWHNHSDARVYRDVIVQVSDDPDFLDAVTVFNNDYDNTSGQGIGEDLGYVETSEGKLVDAGGVEGRYVRLFSRGSHLDDKNHYTEVEVFGKPVD